MDSKNDPEEQPSQVSIFDVPPHLLQFICQLLIDFNDDDTEWLCLRDVMNLRLTCLYFRDVINDMLLLLNCDFVSDFLEPSLYKDLLYFLDFMKSETNWRFSSIDCDRDLPNEPDIFPLLLKYEKLFSRSVVNVKLQLSELNYSLVNKLNNWLVTAALTPKARVEITFVDSFPLLTNSSVVSGAVFETSKFSFEMFLSDSLLRKLSLYTNLRELDIMKNFRIETLELFPSLTTLSVRKLYSSNTVKFREFPNIKILCIKNQKTEKLQLLAQSVEKCFSGLEYFELRLERRGEAEADFSCLSDSCKFVKIPACILQNFRNCPYIQSLCVEHWGSDEVGDNFLQCGKQLNVSFLSLDLWGGDITWPIFCVLLFNLMKQWKCLEVVTVTLFSWHSRCAVLPSDIGLKKIFRSDESYISDDFERELDEMRKIWISSNIQILIFGQSVWMKRSTSSFLLRSLDRLDPSVPPGYSAIRPLMTTVHQ